MLERSGLVPVGPRILVALSGGPDSTALLLALLEVGRDIVAAHFDHSLRSGSDRDAAAVAALCAERGVPLVAERRIAPLGRGSLQSAARDARYDFLARARERVRADLVALAHTRDDRVETLLINLLRGAGPRGLRGMPARRGPYVRPLLAAGRADVLAFLGRTGITPLEDPSNRDLRHMRARVRHRLLPALEREYPDIRERLAALADAAARAQDNPLAADGGRAALTALPPPLRAPNVARLYEAVAGGGPGLGRRHLEAIDRLLYPWSTGSGLDLPRRVRFEVLEDSIRFRPNSAEVSVPQLSSGPRLTLVDCPGCAAPAAIHLKPGRITVGTRRPGLRMRPAGAPGSRKVQDILTDARVERAERDRLPLIFRNDELAWIPGIAYDPEHVTDRSRPGLHAELAGP